MGFLVARQSVVVVVVNENAFSEEEQIANKLRCMEVGAAIDRQRKASHF